MHLPSQPVVMVVAGTLPAARGLGPFMDLSQVLPLYEDRHVAGMVAGAGCARTTHAIREIVRLLRGRGMQPPGGPQ